MPEASGGEALSVLELARIHDDPPESKRVYCLGPGAARINFVTQQIRALNLVWALFQTNQFKSNHRVAVVGAGIAGVTAAIALRGYGASVHLYDKLVSPLARQKGATHREVYPDINFWPETCPPSPSTALPFLNWHFGRCDQVAQYLIDEWENVSELHKFDLEFKQEEIVRIHADEFGGCELSLSFKRGREETGYQLVIVACGYGSDKDHGELKAKDYWSPDGLEDNLVKDETLTHVIVSGSGDGGQIDALRLTTGFRQGRLAFELAKALSPTSLAATFAWSIGRPNENAKKESEYAQIAKNILSAPDDHEFSAARDVAIKGLRLKPPKTIYLVELDGSPYQSNAAVIHKLLVRLAEGKGRLIIRSNSKVAYSSDKKQITIAKTKGTKHTESFPENACRVVIRHGAYDSFSKILSIDEEEIVKKNHAALKHVDYLPKWGEVYPLPSGLTCPVTQRSKFIEENFIRATSALIAFGAGKATLKKSHDCFLYEGGEDGIKLPDHLYGIPLRPAGPEPLYYAI